MLFTDGAAFIEERTDIPVLGVVPFPRDLVLDQEDSMNCDRRRQVPFGADRVIIAVALLPRMSNFTDFNQLAEEEDVALRYATTSGDLAGADVIVLPGTKNTFEYLRYHGQAGSTEAVAEDGWNMWVSPDAGAKRRRSRWGRVQRDCRRVWPAERDYPIADE